MAALLAAGGTLAVSGCQTAPHLMPATAPTPDMLRVRATFEQWPHAPAAAMQGVIRPFFTTIHIADHRVTASGILNIHSPRDFRITAVTELGVILFDARFNWAGATVLRAMPGLGQLGTGVIENIVTDLSTAFRPPPSLIGLKRDGNTLVLNQTEADTHEYRWKFDAKTGRAKILDVNLGLFDTLHVQYKGYTDEGWPRELVMSRGARFYTISITFTDSPMAMRAAAPSGRAVGGGGS